MTCIRIPNGILCVADDSVDLTPYGSAVICDMHHYCGPLFIKKNGVPIGNPSKKTWAAFEAWQKEVRHRPSP